MIKVMKKTGLLASVVVAVAVSTPAIADDVKIGALMPLTGGLAELAAPIRDGAALAVEEANAAGGVLDSNVVLVVKDTQLNPQVGIAAATDLINVDKAVASVGPLASGITSAVASSATIKNKHIIVSPSATSPTITGLDNAELGQDYVFRTAASDAYQGVVLANLVKSKGTNKIAAIYINNDYGVNLFGAFKAAFEAAGGTVTGSVSFDEEGGAKKYETEVTNLAKTGADTLLVITYPGSGGLQIVTDALSLQKFTNFVFTDGMRSDELLTEIGGDMLAGSYGTAPKGKATDGSKRFSEAFDAKYGPGSSQGPFIANNYDAAMILMLAIEKAGNTDSEAIRKALREVANPPGIEVGPGEFGDAKSLIASGEDINYEGAAGSQDFDENGDVPGTYEHWAIEGGEIVTKEIF